MIHWRNLPLRIAMHSEAYFVIFMHQGFLPIPQRHFMTLLSTKEMVNNHFGLLLPQNYDSSI